MDGKPCVYYGWSLECLEASCRCFQPLPHTNSTPHTLPEILWLAESNYMPDTAANRTVISFPVTIALGVLTRNFLYHFIWIFPCHTLFSYLWSCEVAQLCLRSSLHLHVVCTLPLNAIKPLNHLGNRSTVGTGHCKGYLPLTTNFRAMDWKISKKGNNQA